MGRPSAHGVPGGSDAQHPAKSFPAETDTSSIQMVSGLPSASPQMMGSPIRPEIRQVRPVPEMGEGYRETAAGDPY